MPEDLKAIAAQLAGILGGRWCRPAQRLSIPGVIETERWVDTGTDPQMPSDIFNALKAGGYVYRSMVL